VLKSKDDLVNMLGFNLYYHLMISSAKTYNTTLIDNAVRKDVYGNEGVTVYDNRAYDQLGSN